MSRLVRARVKRLEDLPEWAKCCEKAANHNLALGEMTVDLEVFRQRNHGYCRFCERPIEPRKAVMDIADQSYVAFEILDLDESGVEGRQYVEAQS